MQECPVDIVEGLADGGWLVRSHHRTAMWQLIDKLKVLKSDNDGLEQEIETAHEDTRRVNDISNQLKVYNSELFAETERLKADIATLQLSHDGEKEANDTFVAENRRLKEELNYLTDKMQEQKEVVARDAEMHCSQIAANHAGTRQKMDQLEEANRQLEKSLTSAEVDLMLARQNCDKFRAMLRETDARNDEMSAHVIALNFRIVDLEDLNDVCSTDNKNLHRRVAELEKAESDLAPKQIAMLTACGKLESAIKPVQVALEHIYEQYPNSTQYISPGQTDKT